MIEELNDDNLNEEMTYDETPLPCAVMQLGHAQIHADR